MISVFGASISEKEIASVTECMRSRWLGFGKKVTDFEDSFKADRGLDNFLMVDNCSNALYMAIRLLRIDYNAEIIMPSLTWVSCAQAAILAGCKPVFCDVDPLTMNATRETIKEKITPRTKAIMIVHYAGLPADMEPILDLGYPIIEDAAHAVYSSYKGKPCGGIGAIGCYSFDSIKNLVTPDGGGITCKDESLYRRAKIMRYCGIGKSGFEAAMKSNKGRWWEYDIQDHFIKMLPSNISASIGLAQLERKHELQGRRKSIWDIYQKEFDGKVIRPPEAPDDCTHSYFTYCITTDRRDSLARYLFDNGVYTTLRFHPLHMNPIYNQVTAELPHCESINNHGLNLPIHPAMTDEDIDKVVTLVKDYV